MLKTNPWVWTKLTESIKPDRKAGDPVPIEYLTEGYSEYFPYAAWIKKGYVEKNENGRSENMSTVVGQCFDCYDNASFQYKGQTGNFNPEQVQFDYVAKLNKPSTIVKCVSCGRTIEYTEHDGKWKPTVK